MATAYKKRGRFIVFLAIICQVCMVSCHRQTKPQIPTYKSGRAVETDEQLQQTIDLNRRIAEDTDIYLSYFAKEGYSLHPTGYWTKNLKAKTTSLKQGDIVTAQLDTYSIDNNLYYSSLGSVEIGGDQEIAAVGEVLQQMDRGDSVSVIVPWYLAYGSTGNETVAPYSNLRIEIKILP